MALRGSLRLTAAAIALLTTVGLAAEVCSNPALCAAAVEAGAEEGQATNLMQVGALPSTRASDAKASPLAAAGAAREPGPPKAASFATVAATGNATAGREVRHGDEVIGVVYGQEPCNKYTGGTCMTTGSCAASRSSTCTSYMCVCPDYTCSNSAGACEFSPSEVSAAVASGVTNVGAQVSAIANSIPGVATGISGVQGLLGTAGSVIGQALGMSGGCGTTVSSCIFEGCPGSVANTATCNYGACQCMDNFCYSEYNGEAYCTVDIAKITAAVNSLTR
eukprot:CAMPEP_0177250486 /NCGR_PEP_ID=MMETSP0367-20130122/53372_1 /TAXON_ID=447022 ORGANISM="Scrippsiella hangoei-like, Strain SHHI-4" /NCGR_SAMPLE_ID=MMETSP0367 /ASSEMBLY_ACC=CAM_ASM_000362 /LENGTH=277 /DNA_ID=CAMNT_0018703183 /DNA_START=95 /DNA_END=928 /DNA_ORIENTATION=-